jgi:hypothetical protein
MGKNLDSLFFPCLTLQCAVSEGLSNPALHLHLPLSLKTGLIPGFLYTHGTHPPAVTTAGAGKAQVDSRASEGSIECAVPAPAAAAQLAAALRDMADFLEGGEAAARDLLAAAADALSEDFMHSRLCVRGVWGEDRVPT